MLSCGAAIYSSFSGLPRPSVSNCLDSTEACWLSYITAMGGRMGTNFLAGHFSHLDRLITLESIWITFILRGFGFRVPIELRVGRTSSAKESL
jgi:hypothetical protein